MGELKKESKLYEELSNLYDNNKSEITLDVYKEAIKIARKYEKEEIQFVLFKLRYVNSEIETGLGGVNKCLNITASIVNSLMGMRYKLAFIYSVLETI